MTVVFVAGQGRCGSSLTVSMLAAAGFPCVGTAPDYEVDELNHRPVSAEFLQANDGRAMKLLDPMHTPVPRDFPATTIWLTRNFMEQARSHGKFLAQSLGIGQNMYARRQVKQVAASLRRDDAIQFRAVSHCPALTLPFEALILNPLGSALKIRRFLSPIADLDHFAMAAVVRPRSPRCMPGLDIEVANARAAEECA
jgi:hypothetical protein